MTNIRRLVSPLFWDENNETVTKNTLQGYKA
jgi:hypothetical protein